MRPSSRGLILDAAVRVIEREGITGLTYEAIASETGLTKGGLLYHFPSRDDLLIAIQRHITNRWEQELLAKLGKPFAESTTHERIAAYAEVAARGTTTRADLAFVVESVTNPEISEPWRELQGRWLPSMKEADSQDPESNRSLLASLAADGLWFRIAVCEQPLPPPEARMYLAEQIAALAEGVDPT